MIINDARKNIKGKRTSWKRVSDVNIFAAVRLCPVNEYVTKARTEARAGREIAKAFIAALRIRRVRTYLEKKRSSIKTGVIRDSHVRHLVLSILRNALEEWNFPRKELDDTHATKNLL